MSVRELIIKAPYLCGATDASRYSKIAEMIFDAEKNDADSPFKRSRKDIEDPENRVKFAFMFNDGDSVKKAYCMSLARIAELAHYKEAHGDNTVTEELNLLTSEALVAESDYPDVAEVLTVSQAVSAVGGW